MLRRFFLAALFAFAVSPAFAQPAPQPANLAAVRVSLETSAGTILLELDAAHAPVTTANFLRYVDQKRYDGAVFYRAMKLTGTGLIQGGIRDPRKLLPPIAHEPTTQTGNKHVEGAISMARGAPGTATSDFFILTGPMPGLDAHPELSGDNLGFAAFGHVVEGMDVVRSILTAPASSTKGEGVMKGQMLEPEVKIIAAKRVK
jgi:peptidyl-prolyl cis-trans isomerase A (cyclophilin A)